MPFMSGRPSTQHDRLQDGTAYHSPSVLRSALGVLDAMFKDDGQHDFQDGFTFLVDVLHQALDVVKGKKPYKRVPDWQAG